MVGTKVFYRSLSKAFCYVSSVVQVHPIQLMKCSIAAIGDIGKISVTSCNFRGASPLTSTIGNIQQFSFTIIKFQFYNSITKQNVTDTIFSYSFLKKKFLYQCSRGFGTMGINY